jgi:SAM-dependent methyltransferase
MSMTLKKRIRVLLHRATIAIGIDTRKLRPDRQLLERTIFAQLQHEPTYRCILFVGCDWYTLHYPALFKTKRFVTLELRPECAKFGAREHIVDSCTNVTSHFEANSLDCVVFNGVFGFGLNDPSSIERTLAGIHQSLRQGGLLIFGWNDLPDTVPIPLNDIVALRDFTPCTFGDLPSVVYSSEVNRHRFHFYTKGNR